MKCSLKRSLTLRMLLVICLTLFALTVPALAEFDFDPDAQKLSIGTLWVPPIDGFDHYRRGTSLDAPADVQDIFDYDEGVTLVFYRPEADGFSSVVISEIATDTETYEYYYAAPESELIELYDEMNYSNVIADEGVSVIDLDNARLFGTKLSIEDNDVAGNLIVYMAFSGPAFFCFEYTTVEPISSRDQSSFEDYIQSVEFPGPPLDAPDTSAAASPGPLTEDSAAFLSLVETTPWGNTLFILITGLGYLLFPIWLVLFYKKPISKVKLLLNALLNIVVMYLLFMLIWSVYFGDLYVPSVPAALAWGIISYRILRRRFSPGRGVVPETSDAEAGAEDTGQVFSAPILVEDFAPLSEIPSPLPEAVPPPLWEAGPADAEEPRQTMDAYSREDKDAALLALEYERFVGYLCEKEGYSVEYRGAVGESGSSGIDLVATSEDSCLIIQCKRWPQDKPIREDTLLQLSGAVTLMRVQDPHGSYQGVLYTTTTLTQSAKTYAMHVGIEVNELVPYDDYPTVKCFVTDEGKSVYSLPFDAAYDRVAGGASSGLVYVRSAAEAEKKGYARLPTQAD